MLPDRECTTWEEVLAFYDKVGCVLKTEEDCCNLAHYSYGIHRGGAFTPVKCPCCDYYEDNEEKWRAELAEEQGMDEDERKV